MVFRIICHVYILYTKNIKKKKNYVKNNKKKEHIQIFKSSIECYALDNLTKKVVLTFLKPSCAYVRTYN